MIVVESGGTKSTWIFKNDQGEIISLSTVGLHPQELDEYKRSCIQSLVTSHQLEERTLYFFGAGCESQPARDKIRHFLTQFDLRIVQVETDIYAACVAHLKNRAGVVGIMGTGAVAAQFDGEKVTKITSGWGYILGDEGSGFDIGKRLLQSYLKGELAKTVAQDVETYFDGAPILHRVYEPDGRKFIAGLTKVVHKHLHDPGVESLLKASFTDFCKRALDPLSIQSPVCFIGSIAFYFKKSLAKVLNANHYELGDIKQDAGRAIFDHLIELPSK